MWVVCKSERGIGVNNNSKKAASAIAGGLASKLSAL
jgi:hypothetical protein